MDRASDLTLAAHGDTAAGLAAAGVAAGPPTFERAGLLQQEL